jgi:predicted DNA repair protein MutK
MSLGLLALLDDVAAIVRMSAASLDDIAAHAAKAGAKSAGIVIDDTAVTPGYVVGFSPERELPMIWRIAVGSLRNKIVFLLPAALALDALAPWAIVPLLMAGGLYLVFEGAEKVHHALWPHAPDGEPGAHAQALATGAPDAAALEEAQVKGAIRTDFILSAEIMALTLATVAEAGIVTQAAVLAAVGALITAAVYGVVALIVKADDAGLSLVRRGGAWAPVGRLLVTGMPKVLEVLTVLGTAAMLWVGGGILVHGLAHFGLGGIERALHAAGHGIGHALGAAEGFVAWLVQAAGSGAVGLAAGFGVIWAMERIAALRGGEAAH